MSATVRPHVIDNYMEIGRQMDKLIPENANMVAHQLFFLSMPQRRKLVDLENYYEDGNYRGDAKIITEALPDAIIYMTDGFLDDPFAIRIIPYTRQFGLKAAYCFKSKYDDEIILYLKPEWVPLNPDLTACKVPE